MKSTTIYLFSFLGLLLLFACTESGMTEESEKRTDTLSSPANPMNVLTPLTAGDAVYDVKSHDLIFNEDGIPETDIFIYPSHSVDSAYLGKDAGVTLIGGEEERAVFDIPNTAVFAFKSYYAGGGHYYYGLADGNLLKVYRAYLAEPTPESGAEVSEDLSYELYRTYGIYAEKVELVGEGEELN